MHTDTVLPTYTKSIFLNFFLSIPDENIDDSGNNTKGAARNRLLKPSCLWSEYDNDSRARKKKRVWPKKNFQSQGSIFFLSKKKDAIETIKKNAIAMDKTPYGINGKQARITSA